MRIRTLDWEAHRRRVIALVCCCSVVACANGEPVAEGVAVTDVTVIDVTQGVARPGMTVVIQDEEIAVVRPSDQVRLGSEVERISGSGMFLMPGLWDMHTHVLSTSRQVGSTDLPIYIANGVTGIRLMAGGCDPAILPSSTSCMSDTTIGVPTQELVDTWRREIAAGTQVGPEIVAGSMLVDGPQFCWGGGYLAEDSVQARETVEHAVRIGVDFLKIYSCSLSAEGYYAVIEAASRAGLHVAGHVPQSLTWAEASAAGQRSVEHAYPEPLRSCSVHPEEVAAADEAQRANGYAVERQLEYWEALVRTFDVAGCEGLIETFLANGTAFTPTLAVMETFLRLRPGKLPQELSVDADPRLQYLPPQLLAIWKSTLAQGNASKPVPEVLAMRRRAGELMNVAISEMARRGVPILVGSDAGNLLVFPGFSLHEELELLVKAGFTPAQALRAATLESALFLERAQDFGTVEEGKRADLVLLRGNPLNDIRNTQTVEAVLAAGRLFDRAMLDSLLATAARTASTPVDPG